MRNLLSFFLGACAAMMYARYRHRLQLKREGGYRSLLNSCSNWTAGYSCQVNFSVGPLTPSSSSETTSSLGPANTESFATISANTLERVNSSTSNSGALPHAVTAPAPASPSLDLWAAERQSIRDIGNQVGVNVMEFSEQTLDTLLSTIENMRANVVQRRQAREKED